MKFSEMQYVRPDIETVKADIRSCTGALRSAPDFAAADAAFARMEDLQKTLMTADALSYIRHSIDTRDAFYDGEARFLAENLPLLKEAEQEWKVTLLNSPFRADFEEKYGALFLKNMEIELKTFAPPLVPDIQKENALVIEYDNLLASAQIPFEGSLYTLSQLTPLKQDPDDARRRAAWEAEGRFYQEHGERLDALYDELVKVRAAQAEKLGFSDYVELGYYRMGRNCYSRSDVARFREAVVKYVVPLAERVVRAQAERLGKGYPLDFADAALLDRKSVV